MRLKGTRGVPGEALMREAAKRVRRRLAFVAFCALTPAEVSREVSVIFETAAASLHAPTPRPVGACSHGEEGRPAPSALRDAEDILPPSPPRPTNSEAESSPDTQVSASDSDDFGAWERGDMDGASVRPDIDVRYESGGVEVIDRSGALASVEILATANMVDHRAQLEKLASRGGESLELAIVSVVVGFQRHFLGRGVIGLESMSQREVATYLRVHESTVSRAIGDVFVRTPHGTFPLWFFFSAGIRHRSGMLLSVRAVRAVLRSIVLHEPPADPLTDDQLAEQLQAAGLDVARRTVAKYRNILGIPDARRRRGGAWQITPPTS